MDENFLYSLRRDPSPEFAQRLRIKLQQRTLSSASPAAPRRVARTTALAASIALVALAFTFPSVRAAAEAFLGLFRVVNFAAVPVDGGRIAQLTNAQLDIPHMLGEHVELLKQPDPPVTYDSVAAGGAAAGIHVLLPAWIPVGWELSGVQVLGERAMRVTASTTKLKQVLDALKIEDLTIPDALDGQSATVHVYAAVVMTYRNARQTISLLETHRPDAQFPAGLDLPTLGEIGLRILGLDRAEAHRFAQNIDWRTTLVVPVPATAASFRQVDVQGSPALIIQTTGTGAGTGKTESSARPSVKPGERPGMHGGIMLLWSAGDRVFALEGTGLRGSLDSAQLLEMAQSLQ